MSDSFPQNLIDNIPLLVKVLNQNGTGSFFNKGWLEFTGRTLEQDIGSGWWDGVHPEDIKGYLKAVEEACGKRQSNRYEYRLKRADGTYRWILEEGKPVVSAGGGFESYICSGLDITEQKPDQEKISKQYFDEFTGLPNRRFFDDYLRREWGRAARTVRSLTLVMSSASRNSQDNKLLGSAISKEMNRPGDFLALYSDEKFAAILPETDAQGAAVVVDRIRTRVKTLELGHCVPEIGLFSAVPTVDVSTAAELVELAEQAMQQEKKKKK